MFFRGCLIQIKHLPQGSLVLTVLVREFSERLLFENVLFPKRLFEGGFLPERVLKKDPAILAKISLFAVRFASFDCFVNGINWAVLTVFYSLN